MKKTEFKEILECANRRSNAYIRERKSFDIGYLCGLRSAVSKCGTQKQWEEINIIVEVALDFK